jgi:hypothetical protein
LIVIEVTDEVFDRILGEELLELRVELRGERLVMRDDQGWPVDVPDDVRCREGLPRARHPEQRLVPIARLDGLRELGNGLGLIALRRVVGSERKRHLRSPTRPPRDAHHRHYSIRRLRRFSQMQLEKKGFVPIRRKSSLPW